MMNIKRSQYPNNWRHFQQYWLFVLRFSSRKFVKCVIKVNQFIVPIAWKFPWSPCYKYILLLDYNLGNNESRPITVQLHFIFRLFFMRFAYINRISYCITVLGNLGVIAISSNESSWVHSKSLSASSSQLSSRTLCVGGGAYIPVLSVSSLWEEIRKPI